MTGSFTTRSDVAQPSMRKQSPSRPRPMWVHRRSKTTLGEILPVARSGVNWQHGKPCTPATLTPQFWCASHARAAAFATPAREYSRALLSAAHCMQFWCQNACKSTWMDTAVLAAILFNTVLLALENPANILAEETLLLMVAADTVLTVRSDSCSIKRPVPEALDLHAR